MHTAKYYLTATLALGLVACVYASNAEDEKSGHTIKEVMDLAHKKGLYNKVVQGKASEDEKKELAELYADMAKDTPKKGDAEDWKKRAGAVATAAKDVVDNKPNAMAALKMANKCKACHDVFKGK